MNNNMSKCIGCGAPIEIHGLEVSRNQCVYCGTVFAHNQSQPGNSMMGVQGTPVIEERQPEMSRPVAPTVTVNTNFSKVKPAPKATIGGYPILTKKGVALIVVTFIVSVIVVARSWTGNNANNVQTTHWEVVESVFEVAEERVDVYEETTHVNNEACITQMGATLVGSWYWLGSPYYVFNDDGRGEMVGSDIRWVAENGVLFICVTPDFCGDGCVLPTEWYYTVDGSELTLSGRTTGLSFTYTLAQRGISAGVAETLESDELETEAEVEIEENYERQEPLINSQDSFNIDMELELYPFRIAINEIFIVDGASTPPEDGNKYVGISFIFTNISNEAQWISSTQVSIFVDGFLTSQSFSAGFEIGRSRGSYSINTNLSAGRSVRSHYAVEIPIGTTEIEMEINCGTFGARQQTEIIRLDVPQR